MSNDETHVKLILPRNYVIAAAASDSGSPFQAGNLEEEEELPPLPRRETAPPQYPDTMGRIRYLQSNENTSNPESFRNRIDIFHNFTLTKLLNITRFVQLGNQVLATILTNCVYRFLDDGWKKSLECPYIPWLPK